MANDVTPKGGDVEFKLRCELVGHSKDVRCLAEFSGHGNKNCVVSGSRDLTVRFWEEVDESHFNEYRCAKGHTNFVSAVAFMAPADSAGTSSAPKIFSSGYDSSIRAYDAQTGDFLYVLNGHQNSVVCLATDRRRQQLISGSADCTIIVWHDEHCLRVLAGHHHIVWSLFVVCLADSSASSTISEIPSIVSASADKTVQLWSDGKSVKTFAGHTDCVRGVVQLTQSEFLSAGNDATIRRWNLQTGDCLMVYSGHDGFIYSIAYRHSYDYFVTGAEDKSIRLWNLTTGACTQVIHVPAQSVWSVLILYNGDVACGTSDAAIRVFTRDQNRVAKPDVLAAYDNLVKAFCTAGATGEIGGIKIADLPGPEALRQVGTKDGQTKMIRIGDKVELHKWSDAQAAWEKIGDVLGAPEPASGKKMYMGKEYDYVFDIDVEDGKPTLKLPYDTTEDPWYVAQKFIHDHFLPQSYLETVANFIVTNAGSTATRSNSASTPNKNASYSDPLTGQSRYQPQQQDNITSDPSKIDKKRPRGENIPLSNYITFTLAAGSCIVKLKENNAAVNSYKLNDEQIFRVEKFLAVGLDKLYTEDIVEPLNVMMRWPKQYLVPCLDVLRLALLNRAAIENFFSTVSKGKDFADKLCRLICEPNAPPTFCILVPRCFANATKMDVSRPCLISISDVLCKVMIDKCLFHEKAAAQIATSACLANFSYAFLNTPESAAESQKKKDFAKELFEGLQKNVTRVGQLDQEAISYLLQSLVTLLWGCEDNHVICKLANENRLKPLVERLKDVVQDEKSKNIARCIDCML